MKRNFWKHAASLFMAGVLAVSLLAVSASAASYEEEQELVDKVCGYSSVPDGMNRTAYYQGLYDDLSALIRKYPKNSELYYARANFILNQNSELSGKADLNTALADYDKAISLEKQNVQSDTWFYTGQVMQIDIGEESYKKKAEVYLYRLAQQDAYLQAMQEAVDIQKKNAQAGFGYGINASGYVESFYNAAVKQKQLNEVKAWAASNGTSFHAWDDRVQVTGGAGSTTITVRVQESANAYPAVQYEMTFSQPIQAVVRGLSGMNIIVPDGTTGTLKTTSWSEDGSAQTTGPESCSSYVSGYDKVGYASEFSREAVSVPADVAASYDGEDNIYERIEWGIRITGLTEE